VNPDGHDAPDWAPQRGTSIHTVRDKIAAENGGNVRVSGDGSFPFNSDLKAVRDLNLTEAGRKARNSGTFNVLDVFHPPT
jgi:hypothetical protein